MTTQSTDPLDIVAASPSFSGDELSVLDPARNRILAHVKQASEDEVDDVVLKARLSFESGVWSQASVSQRGTVLIEAAERIRAHANELATLDSLNVGKPIVQARSDASGAAEIFDHCGRVISAMTEEVITNTGGKLTLVFREPVGVVVGIIPWNYPIATTAATIAPALAAGNSVVLKPSSETPLSAMRLMQVVEDLFPDGVLEVVPGDADVGRRLVQHPGINRVHFTGSTRAGREIMRSASDNFARVGLELGGKAPTVVLDDAPFEEAVASALWRFTANQGENCAAGSRLLIHERLYEHFLERIIECAAQLVVGDPQDDDTQIGPMITAAHKQRILSYTQSEEGGRCIYSGAVPESPPLSDGFYVPVSIWEAPRNSALWQEEVFGPVLTVARFASDDEAVELANDTQYGLMAHIWSGERGRALRMAKRMRAGVIRVNRGVEDVNGPWGGVKASGMGRNFGRYGIEASSELKQICLDIS